MNSNQNLQLGDNLLNTVFFDRYRLVEKLGEGTFGMIFKCESSDGLCAFKIEKKRPNKKTLLKTESEMMIYLKGPGIPRIISYIENNDYNIMIMELLGKSIENLLKNSEKKKLSLKSVCLFGIQSLKILKNIHDKHIIHRDIKPDNFAIGYSDPKKIYLLDFGLAKKYRSSKTLEQKPMQKNKKLTGTARYASINALAGCDQSRRDDLEGLSYVLAYLLRGNLPWQGLVVKTKEEKYAKILQIKKSTSSEELLKGFPKEMIRFLEYCKNLMYEQDPDYDFLKSLLENVIIEKLGEKIDMKFDWVKDEINLSNSIKEDYIESSENVMNNLSLVNNMNSTERDINLSKFSEFNNKHKNVKKSESKVNYYDDVMNENKLDKNEDTKDDEEDTGIKNVRDKKHAACCNVF